MSDAPSGEWMPARLLTAAFMLAASPATIALAQSPNLPPVVVEGAKAKKKKAAAPAKQTPAPPPAPVAVQPAQDPPGSYKVERASSSKMTGPLLDTPQTVTVIPGTIIEERGSTNLTEVLKNTPGISFNAGENAFSSSPSNFQLRGFDTSGNIFIDGARDSGSYARDMFNVERVEVVKGAAADNGRGGAGGYINIVTKTPTLDNFVKGEASLAWDQYDSEVRRRATIDVNQFSGNVAVRLNGMIEDGGIAGREIAEAKAFGLAPSIAFGLGTRFRAIFSYEHLQRNDLSDWGVPAAMIPGMKNFNAIAAQASRDNFYGLRSDFDDVRADAATARFEYDLVPGVTISNQTRWSQTDRFARFTFPNGFTPVGPGGTVVTNTAFYDRVNTSLTNQTNLTGTFFIGGLKHVVSTGLEFTRETSDANRQNQIANVGGQPDIFDPNPDRALGPAFVPKQLSGVTIDTAAVYLYDTIHLNRQWQIVGGLRLEHYNVDIDSKLLPAGTPTGPDGYSDSATTLGGKLGVVYKPIPNASLYAAYGVSALPPGSLLSNPDISREGANGFPGFVPGADPIEAHNYELGAKWDFFGGRLSTTAALFRTERHNVPYVGVAPHPAIVYGEQIVQGVELGVAGNLTERLKVFGGVTWLDSERRHGKDVDDSVKGDYPAGVTTTNGDELSFTPNFFATLWLTYAVTDKLTVGGGVQYVGDSWLGRPDDALRVIPNGTFGKLPDYVLVNLMMSYALTDNIDLRFNVDNVFDETYAVSSNWPGTRAILGAPRTFRIGTAFKF